MQIRWVCLTVIACFAILAAGMKSCNETQNAAFVECVRHAPPAECAQSLRHVGVH